MANTTLSRLNVQLADLDAHLADMDARLSRLNARLSRLNARLSRLNARLAGLIAITDFPSTSALVMRYPPKASETERATLASLARETQSVLPGLLLQIPDVDAHDAGVLAYDKVAHLDPVDCPHYPPLFNRDLCRIRVNVVNQDSLDAAIQMQPRPRNCPSAMDLTDPWRQMAIREQNWYEVSQRVCVLHIAAAPKPGGGWLNAEMAQKDSIWHRSSLALSLEDCPYPLDDDVAVYSPDVLVIRSAFSQGHKLLSPWTPVTKLPVVSVISVAAIRNTPVRTLDDGAASECSQPSGAMFADPSDREMAKNKMRLALRIAAHNEHRFLVLGALGCDASGTPPDDAARCWDEVLDEDEFQGGWWEEIRFAVPDTRGDGHYEAYKRVLAEDKNIRVTDDPGSPAHPYNLVKGWIRYEHSKEAKDELTDDSNSSPNDSTDGLVAKPIDTFVNTRPLLAS